MSDRRIEIYYRLKGHTNGLTLQKTVHAESPDSTTIGEAVLNEIKDALSELDLPSIVHIQIWID